MMSRVRLLVLVVALASPALLLGGAARADEAKNDARLWLTAVGRVSVIEEVSASLLLQTRFSDDVSDYERLLVSAFVSRPIAWGFSGSLGYDAHLLEVPDDQTEHRIWQQLGFRHGLAQTEVGISHIARLEERFIDRVDPVAMRLRYLLRGELPLSPVWSGVLANELFLNLNSTRGGPRSGFDENRTFVGLGYDLGPGVELQGGYMLQYIDGGARTDSANHVLWLVLSFAP